MVFWSLILNNERGKRFGWDFLSLYPGKGVLCCYESSYNKSFYVTLSVF